MRVNVLLLPDSMAIIEISSVYSQQDSREWEDVLIGWLLSLQFAVTYFTFV